MASHLILPACTSCAGCVAVCPTGSIFLGLNQYVIDRDTCSGCAICVRVCPVDAIRPVTESTREKEPKEAPRITGFGRE